MEPLTLMLVHSPLVGPLTWEFVAAHLRNEGWRVVVPSLTADGPPYYQGFAESAAGALDGGPVVLVGHSGAGALLPAVAEAVGDDVRGAVFVDALLPCPGRSWFDTAPAQLREQLAGMARDGWLPPWNEWFPADAFNALVPDVTLRERFVADLPAVPMAYFAETAPDAPGWPAVRCAYVCLSEAYGWAADEAERQGWWVRREDADHLAPLTQPARIAAVITEVVTPLRTESAR